MLNITKEFQGKKMTVALESDLDRTTSPELEEKLSAALDDVQELVLDLAKLDYISSAGLRVFIKFQKRMDKQGSMTVTNVGKDVMEIFRLSGFTTFIKID